MLNLGFIVTLVISIFSTYFFALFLLASTNKLARILMRTKEGEIKGIDVILWAIQSTTLDIAYTLSKKIFIHSPFPDLIYCLFGFKRRKGVSVLAIMYDPDLIEIGENSMIGTHTIISGHHIRRGKLYRKRIKIGKNVTIGGLSILAGGVTIGDNTMVAYGSSIPPNWTLDSNCLYGGVPVKKLKSFEQNASEK
jgi:hypothetical protein